MTLAAKNEAYWDSAAKLATCTSCVESVRSDGSENGEAGGSALAKAQELSDRRTQVARKKWGDQAAKVAAQMAKEDPSIRAWDKGGHGESRLGSFIEREVGNAVIALHDRVIPGLNGQNIDHLFVAPSGVWIVDAKTYKGKIERRDAGPIWRADFRSISEGAIARSLSTA